MSSWPGRIQPNLSRRPRRWAGLLAAVAIAVLVAVPAMPAHAAAAPARTVAPRGSGLLTDAQALARAHAIGKPVPVTGATTDASTLTANPNGTFTLTRESAPVRKKVAGRWAALDATLRRNSDGSLSPAVTTSLLRLSGGGTGPLAVMTDNGASLSLALPGRLPGPVLSGATATYANVWPGTDLQVTADDQGGFSEVLVVKNAAAAANPALRQLTFRTAVTGGISLHADPAGNLAATTRGGHAIFTAPAPAMWDSAAPAKLPPVAVNPATRQRVDARNGLPIASSATSPGTGARAARVGVRAAPGALTLVPDPSVLAAKNTVYPVYIDPSYAAGSTEQAWAQVDSAFPSQAYWKQSGLLQVGDNNWNSPYFVARSFVQESVPSTLYTATIYSSTVYFTDEWSPSCSATEADLYWTGPISSSTTWSNQPSWNTKEAAKSYAYGYNSGCPAASVGYDITSLMKTAASGKWTNMTLGLRAANESDGYGWKQFSHTVTMSTTYDHAPNTPTSLTTSPASSCSASTPTTVGNGDVILYAGVSDPDGGSLSATFSSWNTSTSATLDNATVSATSGTTAALRIKQATLDAAAGTAITEFSWTVKVSDGSLSSGTSTTCHFKLDPTSPGPPSINACEGTTGTIGTAVSFSIARNTTGVTPTSYDAQLNGAAPQTVKADTSGNATVTVTPTRGTDALTVTAISAGGNVGDSATCVFNATTPTPAADGDLTGDGIPDLITAGGTSGTPPGLWLAKAQAGSGLTAGDGQIITSGIDIGVEGNGIAGDYSPADFTGAQAVTGLFTDSGLQDNLVYYPAGTYAGQAVVMAGTGDGSVLENKDAANTTAISTTSFTATDPNGDIPQQVANGYNADPNDNPAYPDLIARSGDATNGYYLEYYQNAGSIGTYYNSVSLLSTASPDGTMDWNNWQVATMARPSGSADMFLYNATTGALWLWENLTVEDTAGTASYSAYQISASWNPGTITAMRAADINGDGTPDLWTVTPSGTVTSWFVTGLSGTPAITTAAGQALLGPTHAWRLGDGTSGAATTAADTGGSGSPLALTGNSGTTWDTSDLFNPAVAFDGSTGYMSTNAQAINTTSSYTVSAWVKPTTLSGIVLSEYGSLASCMRISISTTTSGGITTGYWRFATTNQNSASATSTAATEGTYPIHLGSWTHLTVTYNASDGRMSLYVDGVRAAGAVASSTWSSGCTTFALDRWNNGGYLGGAFNGKIADVQTWNGTYLTPTQIATLSGTPGYELFPSDGHQYSSAPTSSTWQWVTANGKMQFYQGVLTITETGSGTVTKTWGQSGHTGAVLTLQTDGNLVIYPTIAGTGALWASNTAGNTGDVMFFQPDGNLVIYGPDGQSLWSSGTAN
jgi:hypothetical protein